MGLLGDSVIFERHSTHTSLLVLMVRTLWEAIGP